jgi:ribosomal protein S18 acetylase RimI-like enzyme
MPDDLSRAFDFIARGDMAGSRSAPTRFGTFVSAPEFALRLDSNYLLVDRLPRGATAAELAADADEAHAAARLAHRSIMLRDAGAAERLAAGLAELGWDASRSLVMAHRRQPERAADTGIVAEVAENELRPAREEHLATYPWASPDVVRALIDGKVLIPVEKRFFAVVVDGRVASFADLYGDGPVAQVEDVATLERFRGRGFASAVVLRAVEEARLVGADLVFLVARADDWPHELYRRLGFDEIGRYVKFQKLPEPG